MLTVYGVLVTSKIGPFTLRREYAAPGAGLEQSERLDEFEAIVTLDTKLAEHISVVWRAAFFIPKSLEEAV